MSRRCAVLVIAALLAASCSASDGSQVSVGPFPTTPPLAIPPVLRQPDTASAANQEPLATIVPVADPTAIPTALPTQEPTQEPEEPAAAPTALALPDATRVPATPVPATPAPASPAADAAPESATEPATETAAAPVQAAPAGATGPAIPLGDFDVVNLVTRETQNIAELSPSGATVLWFWAPH